MYPSIWQVITIKVFFPSPDNTALSSLVLPDSLVNIGHNAFADTNLETVIIPFNLALLNYYAIMGILRY